MAAPAAGAGRAAALKESMRRALEKKRAAGAPAAPAAAAAGGAAAGRAARSTGLDSLDGLDGPDGGERGGQARPAPIDLDALDGLDEEPPPRPSPPGPGGAAAEPAGAEEDPWPELRLAPTRLGVEDGRGRAAQLRRQGDFTGAARMWAKVVHVALHCRPQLDAAEVAELEAHRARACVDAEDWAGAERAGLRALAEGAAGAPAAEAALLALQARARARMELGDARGARADLEDAQARLRALADPSDEAVAAALDLEERWRRLHQPAAGSAPPRGGEPAPDQNQEFFNGLEREWAAACATDGWDEVLGGRASSASAASVGSEALAPAAGAGAGTAGAGAIPAGSDYYRVQRLLEGRPDRELRPGGGTGYEPRCRRDLSELRRVEAETQQAIERERARMRGAASEPIRTRSDAVRVDSLDSDSEDGEAAPEDAQKLAEAERAFAAFSEFQQMAREKEERLAKWRGRWG